MTRPLGEDRPGPGPAAVAGDPSRGEIPRVGHVAALDGLRGLAILMVMVFHQADFPPRTALEARVAGLVQLGGSGVELFFVLSGFLITGILIGSTASPHYYRNFYARRFLRIFPLYYLILAVAFFAVPHLAPSRQEKWAHVAGWNQLWYWSYLSNWYIAIAHGGPTHGMVDLSWSLSVEEQFYLAWPFAVAWLSRGGLAAACAVLIAAGPLFRLAVMAAGRPAIWAVFLTPANFDALGVGAALAICARGPGGLSRLRAAAWPALAIGLAAALAIHGGATSGARAYRASMVLGPSALALAFGAMLVLAATAPPGSATVRALGGGPMATLGKYSYALYLFHNPIQAAMRATPLAIPRLAAAGLGTLGGAAAFCALASAAALACAWLSWHLFEEPILRLKRFFPSGDRRAEASPRPAFAAGVEVAR